jgi:Rad3-related DNA helicase
VSHFDKSASHLQELVKSNFPHQNYRTGQLDAIEEIAAAFSDGYKYVVLDAPTGSGKSAINTAFARAAQSCYYTTPQNSLIDQIADDDVLGNYYEELKGKSHYECQNKDCRIEEKGTHTVDNCPTHEHSEGEIGLKKKDSKICCDTSFVHGFLNPASDSRFSQARFEQYLNFGNTCEYPLRLYKALSSDMMLTNIFLFIVAPYIESRDLCVIDESHNIENTLFNFVDTSITENTVPFFDKISDTIPTENAEKCIEYLNSEEFEKTLKQEIQHYKSAMNDVKEVEVHLRTDEEKSELWELKDKVEQCRKLKIKVDRLNELDEDAALEEKHNEEGEFCGVVLKPIYCSDFFERNIAPKASHFLLSSATFSNAKKVLELLGVDRSDVKVVSIQSDFPVENRPVEFKDVTSLKHDLVEDGDLRDISASILSIMTDHKDEKGIVHCGSYDRQSEIYECLQEMLGPGCERLMTHKSHDADEKLDMFKKSSGNKVLLSVAKEEGIDLSGDEARFNVLVKTPNPYSEDPRVKYRIEENREWEWFFGQTASSTAQAYGRTTRSKTDWSKFYILDSHFKSFYDRQKHLLPDWFVQAAEKSDLGGVSA